MTNLSNSELLDENIGNTLKNERLQQTANAAQNIEGQVIQMNPNMMNEQQQPIMQQQVQQPIMQPQQMNYQQNINKDYIQQPQQRVATSKRSEGSENNSYNEDNESVSNNLSVKDYNKSKTNSSNDNNILGMKPIIFYSLTALAIGLGGYLLYKKFGKVKVNKNIDVKIIPNSEVASSVVNSTITAAKPNTSSIADAVV